MAMFYDTISRVFFNIFFLYPIWLPIILGIMFFSMWLAYRRAVFIVLQGSILLEILLPREISKSPAAMEVILAILYQTGSASYAETFIDGKIRPWFSLELVSLEGKVHFYIWSHKKWRNMIEAQIYAQYPEVEVREAEDYSLDFVYTKQNQGDYILWGTNFILQKPSPIPMKTYIDYGLDRDPKEEFKIDPLTSVLEYLGSLGPGEQAWIQILIQAHKRMSTKEGEPHFSLFFEKVGDFLRDPTWKSFRDIYHLKNEDWREQGKVEISKIRDSLKQENLPERRPTKGESDIIAGIERRLTKFPFETMVRGFYIAKKENFNAIGITGLIGSVRQYNAAEQSPLNGFKLGRFTDWPDNRKDFFRYFFKKYGLNWRRREEQRYLAAYKLRSFFHYPYRHLRDDPYILTSEEIATIYHFPGEVAATPGFSRIPSKKGQAPSDLPV
jgi:hypothetical protein